VQPRGVRARLLAQRAVALLDRLAEDDRRAAALDARQPAHRQQRPEPGEQPDVGDRHHEADDRADAPEDERDRRGQQAGEVEEQIAAPARDVGVDRRFGHDQQDRPTRGAAP
jgi:hypothetical protein